MPGERPLSACRDRVMITGGAGFIGSALIRRLLAETGLTVVNVDKLTYAGNLESLGSARDDGHHIFVHADISDQDRMSGLLQTHRPSAIFHLAAESHVDRSIHGPADFIQTNMVGTYALLESARRYCESLADTDASAFRFIHVSTDEVYGDLDPDEPAFTEDRPYAPSSPYAASKAGSDHLVRAWHRTYGLPVVVTNCSNNYGPYQFPEKLIPLMILRALERKPLPIYGDGRNVRDWLYVTDHADALMTVLERGRPGATYNIGGGNELTNLSVVEQICARLDDYAGHKDSSYKELITFVTDRPGHDRRYAMNHTRITTELGWTPRENFASGLDKTVRWYLDNPDWVDRVSSGAYRQWIDQNYSKRGASG